MTLALLCSGQGHQHAGMFDLTGDAPEAASLFAHAATLLGGRDPRELVRTETSDVLHHDRVAQILCTLQALAAAAALRDVWPDHVVVAGYSVGEMAAWGVAGLMSASDTLDLAARRAEAMDAAGPAGDSLMFIRGLSRDAIEALCARHGAAIAIVDPDDAFILGGSRAVLRMLAEDAKATRSAHIVDIPVEVASHTPRLAKASQAFRENLRRVSVEPAPITGRRLLSGIDGLPVVDSEAGLDKLAAQISRTVQWADCLQACIESDAITFFELGPGSALSRMVANTYRDVAARSLADFKTLDGARDWLASHGSRCSS